MAGRQRKGKVYLFTLDHGYGYLFNRWARQTSRGLVRCLGASNVIHQFLPTRDLFTRLSLKNLLSDRREYGQWFGCCLGCTMAMVTKILIFNLERLVPHIAIGSSVGGQYAVMSTPANIVLLREFCAQYGVLYHTPLLDDGIRKPEEREMLREAGVDTGRRFLDKHSFGNQGYCLLSLQHLPDVLFNVHSIYDPAQTRRFFLDKISLCEAYIAEHFRKAGQDLKDRVRRLKAITNAAGEAPDQ